MESGDNPVVKYVKGGRSGKMEIHLNLA